MVALLKNKRGNTGLEYPTWILKFLASDDCRHVDGRMLLLALNDDEIVLQEKPRMVWDKAEAKLMHRQGKKMLDEWLSLKPWEPVVTPKKRRK